MRPGSAPRTGRRPDTHPDTGSAQDRGRYARVSPTRPLGRSKWCRCHQLVPASLRMVMQGAACIGSSTSWAGSGSSLRRPRTAAMMKRSRQEFVQRSHQLPRCRGRSCLFQSASPVMKIASEKPFLTFPSRATTYLTRHFGLSTVELSNWDL